MLCISSPVFAYQGKPSLARRFASRKFAYLIKNLDVGDKNENETRQRKKERTKRDSRQWLFLAIRQKNENFSYGNFGNTFCIFFILLFFYLGTEICSFNYRV